MLTTLIAAAASGAAGGALVAGIALSFPGRRLRGLESALMDDILPTLITRQEVGEAFARVAMAEQQREQMMLQRSQQELQMARQMELQRAQAAAMQASPLFQGEPQTEAAGTFQARNGQSQAAVDQLNEQLNRQLAQLNQRLQQVTAQQMPR